MSQTTKPWTKWVNGLFWIAVLGVAVYLIAQNLGVVGNVLLVLVGFGAVVLVHEFGHFITAKLGGIKVEAFSICMPPTLLGIRRTRSGFKFRVLPGFSGRKEPAEESPEDNDATEYRIGLFPFGGYVKLLGQEDTGPVKQNDDPRSFAKKPISIRAAVIAAGVIFNVISAAIIFMIVFLVGISLMPAVVGDVVPNSPADKAGLQPGDEILAIDGTTKDLDFSNIMISAALSRAGQKIPATVRRADGSVFDTTLVAENMGRPFREFGIDEPRSLTVAQVSKSGAEILQERTGLRPEDRVVAVNGQKVEQYWQFNRIVTKALTPTVEITAERKAGDQIQTIQTRLPLNWTTADAPCESDLGHVYSLVPRLCVKGVTGKATSSSNSEKNEPTRLKAGDIIVAAGDVAYPTYRELREITTKHEGQMLTLKVLRNDANDVPQTLSVTVKPRRAPGETRVIIGFLPGLDAHNAVVAKAIPIEGHPALDIPRGARIVSVNGKAVTSFFDIINEVSRWEGPSVTLQYQLDGAVEGGVTLPTAAFKNAITIRAELAEAVPFKPFEKLYRAKNPIDAMAMGYRRTLGFIAQTYVTLARLLRGLISPDNLMGPLGIITVSYRIVAEQPLVNYAYFLGLISATIAVMNFLPLPPFDGGLIVLMLIEKIKGSALTDRTQGLVAYVGWGLVMVLLVYVTFNDIVRSFFNS
ncbi:MAG TPA: site-2 protease family protein [Sedimentisphaerales bacterium]|mgnify:FL=1|nr:site-2 protease family protein [Sedimentisphaerales bacterium]